MYDCAIIGTGAAGVSAALTLKALKRNFLLIGNPQLSAKIRKAERIKNYPGLSDVSGEQLQSAFLSQLENEQIAVTVGKVTGVYDLGGKFGIAVERDYIEAKTIILACGVESVKPVKGEHEFLGRGVSYCAVCDGFLYKGKTVAAVVTTKEEESEVEFLAGFAKKLYLFPLYKDVQIKAANVEIIKALPKEIAGGERVEKIITKDGEIAVDGVFMLKESTAGDGLIAGLKTEEGRVLADRNCRTNLEGVFAAGDCTGRPYQYAKAVGEGNVAAHSVNDYLNGVKA